MTAESPVESQESLTEPEAWPERLTFYLLMLGSGVVLLAAVGVFIVTVVGQWF